MDNTYSKVKEEQVSNMIDEGSSAICAMDMIKRIAKDTELSDEQKVARVNYVLLISEGKAGCKP
jgi:hypothetical protein